MILRPEFHFPPAIDRAAERAALGLPTDAPVGLVLFGGTGSRVMAQIARELPDVPLILMCGRNEALAQRLRDDAARSPAAARVVVGHTAEVARWMQRADFFIGKPGPGSLSEAVQMGLPVLTTRNAWTMPQERWNTEWVQQQGLGVVMRRFADVRDGVHELLRGLPAFQARVRPVHNQAVFEVPRVLQRVLDTQGGRPAQAGWSTPIEDSSRLAA